jgi:hypothetical protein
MYGEVEVKLNAFLASAQIKMCSLLYDPDALPVAFSREKNDRSVKLTTNLHLVLRLRMRLVSSPLSHTSSWRGA